MEGIRNRNNNHKQEVDDNNHNTALLNSAQDVPKKGKIIEYLSRNWKVIGCSVFFIVSLFIVVMLFNVYRENLQFENTKLHQETEQLRLKDMQGERDLEALKLKARKFEIELQLKQLEIAKEEKILEFENQERSREYDLKVKQEYEKEMETLRMKNEHSQFILNHKTENVRIVTNTIQELNQATVITRTQNKNGIFSSESQSWQEVNRLRISQKTEQDLNRLLESIEYDSHLLIGQMEEEKKGDEEKKGEEEKKKDRRHKSRN